MLQGLGQLQASGLRHVDVQEHDVAGIFFQLLDGLAHAGRFSHDLGLAEFVKQELELGTRGRLVVNDDRF